MNIFCNVHFRAVLRSWGAVFHVSFPRTFLVACWHNLLSYLFSCANFSQPGRPCHQLLHCLGVLGGFGSGILRNWQGVEFYVKKKSDSSFFAVSKWTQSISFGGIQKTDLLYILVINISTWHLGIEGIETDPLARAKPRKKFTIRARLLWWFP